MVIVGAAGSCTADDGSSMHGGAVAARNTGPAAKSPQTAGTETTNPPVIDPTIFSWFPATREGVVTLSGGPGSVSPGGTTLIVKNLRTGDERTVVTNEDGSFTVDLPGSFSDGFSIVAKNGKKSSTTTVSEDNVERGAPPDAGGSDARTPRSDAGEDASTDRDAEMSDAGMSDAGKPAGGSGGPTIRVTRTAVDSGAGTTAPVNCAEAQISAAAQVARATSVVDARCTTAADCVFLRPSLTSACSASCSLQVASKSGAASVSDLVQAIGSAACEDFTAAGCKLEQPKCDPETRELACMNGTCAAVDPTGGVCQTMAAAEEKRYGEILASLDRSCRTQMDCTVAELGTSCHRRCLDEPIALASNLTTILNAQLELDGLCENFDEFGCQQVVDTCPEEVERPLCMNGRCTRAP